MNTPAHWKKFTPKTLALLPLSLLYRLGTWLDRETSSPMRAPLPVISLGNVTAGGTGKTPATLALVPLLTAIGFTPHILTRGYKSEKPLHAHHVTPEDTAATVGDEALLLTRAAPTWVGQHRLASARAAQKSGATLALCDDAHQHYRLHKDVAFLVIDGPYGFGNGQLIPAGPLREPVHHAFARAHAVILIGNDAQNLAERITIPVFRAQLTPAKDKIPHADRWLAFAGIGRPEKFFDTLRDAGLNLVGTQSFPDHHLYSDADLTTLRSEARRLGAQLITTEKDAVKLPADAGDIAVLPVALTFENPAALSDFLRASLTT